MEKLIVSPGFVKKIEDEQDTQDQAITSNSSAIANVQNGLAYIVGNTNTTGGTLAVGQFVYVKNHSTIAEGLRKVTASISANGNITTSNTSECTEGGLNKLKGDVDALNSNITTLQTTKAEIFATGSVSANSSAVIEVGRGRIYVLVCGGAYATGSMYIIFGWTAGSGRVQTVKANSAVTITIDSERKVTIASTEGISYSFVDIGTFA